MEDALLNGTKLVTWEALQSLPGKVSAVLLIVQGIKASWPQGVAGGKLEPFWVRANTFLVAVALELLLAVKAGAPFADYALAIPNGALVALAAMKTAEFVRSR